MFSSTRCFHISGITLALNEKARACGIEMIKRFKEHGALISFDVNFRLNLWSGAEAKACIEQILPYVDIFFLFGGYRPADILKEERCRISCGVYQGIPSPSWHPPSGSCWPETAHLRLRHL